MNFVASNKKSEESLNSVACPDYVCIIGENAFFVFERFCICFHRFGKGRKSDEEAMRRSRSEERTEDRVMDRRADHSSEHPAKDWWAAQPYGDTQKKWPASADEQNHQQQRGRKSSQQEQERFEAVE